MKTISICIIAVMLAQSAWAFDPAATMPNLSGVTPKLSGAIVPGSVAKTQCVDIVFGIVTGIGGGIALAAGAGVVGYAAGRALSNVMKGVKVSFGMPPNYRRVGMGVSPSSLRLRTPRIGGFRR